MPETDDYGYDAVLDLLHGVRSNDIFDAGAEADNFYIHFHGPNDGMMPGDETFRFEVNVHSGKRWLFRRDGKRWETIYEAGGRR